MTRLYLNTSPYHGFRGSTSRGLTSVDVIRALRSNGRGTRPGQLNQYRVADLGVKQRRVQPPLTKRKNAHGYLVSDFVVQLLPRFASSRTARLRRQVESSTMRGFFYLMEILLPKPARRMTSTRELATIMYYMKPLTCEHKSGQ